MPVPGRPRKLSARQEKTVLGWVAIRVVGNDITDKYLLLTNSHDGKSSLQVRFTPVRVVCQNTLTLALSQGGDNGGLKLSHHTDIHRRFQEAERMLGIVRHQYDTLAETFREMTRVFMNKERLGQYLSQVFPGSIPAESTDAAPVFQRDRVWAEYFFDQRAGNRMPGVQGTLWAAYNGVTEWLDHRKTRQSAPQRLTSIWFGEAIASRVVAIS